MTEQETIDRFCVYAVAADYGELHEALRMRVAEIKVTHESIDAVSGLQSGYTSKILAPLPSRSLGKVSLGPMLQTLGLALVIVKDDEAFQKVKARLGSRKRSQLANANPRRPKWLFTAKNAGKMGTKRWSVMTDKQKKRHLRKMWKARDSARRRRKRESAISQAPSATASPAPPRAFPAPECP